MNLWLDDVRKCPFIGNWKTAKNFDEAVKIMQENEIEEAWLDHDLAYEHYGHVKPEEYTEKTGYDFVLWMKENNRWPTKLCIVHSLNPVGSERMCEVIAEHYGTQNPKRHYISYLNIEKYFQGFKYANL
jgi:hypothetical protein